MTRPCGRWLAVALLWLAGLGYCAAEEVIHSFDSTVVLAKDGELTVTERIEVRAEGQAIRRGIFRDFPLTFTDAQGKEREVSFTLLEVTRDGKPEPHSTQRNRGVIRIYAGDKDTFLPTGDYTYVIRYRTGRQVRWFDGKAELNWNVTGNFWDFPIAAASYRLELDDAASPTRWTAYAGPLGARGTAWQGAIGADGALTVSTTALLDAGEGLTVVAELPDGAVTPLTKTDVLRYAFYDNRAWIFGGLGSLLLLGYYLASWNAVGRDPKRGIIIPLFHPPKDISPALANYIANWGLDRAKWRAFTAAALSLAVQGLLRFDDSDGVLTLKTTDKASANAIELPPGENAILYLLKQEGGTLVIDKKHGTTVAAIGSKFSSEVVVANRNRFFRLNLGYVLGGLSLTIATLVMVGRFGGVLGEYIWVFFMAGLVVLNGIFVFLMRAPTVLGRPVMDQLEGFKLYLKTAESDSLNLQAPEITAEQFEAMLPYAVALNVEKPWSEAFAAALQRAHPDDTDPMRHYHPAWTNASWSSAHFGRAVASTVAATSSALASAVPASSSSSGFSGGSGGGGGGGGGGGW